MAFLLSPLRLGLGLGIGISAVTLHPLSPFRTAPLQCQYNAPYSSGSQSAESSWAVNSNNAHWQKEGRSGIAAQVNGFMTPENMKQISLGSVLGLVAGVGLRAFSRVLVVLIGMGIVLVEVRFYRSRGPLKAWKDFLY
ncbi:uncharacterized protein N7477_008017 [Penicillium maclennaniae]|uniref:uncharacterized protein n=1 Tax=Penicillium maclennaniae TaxID=1343394 RepID=UPI00253FEA05|nr:uncharacterized protein N7477_008017 [Penicillium maclennaniae]KAJ5665569.1 hypothetical protein N7477_008017 [Penicillium maclennaniae]